MTEIKVKKKADQAKEPERKVQVRSRKILPKKRLFAVVRGKRGRKNFRKWHEDQSEAWAEAKRLAAKEGGLFFVIETKATVVGDKPREDEEDLSSDSPEPEYPKL